MQQALLLISVLFLSTQLYFSTHLALIGYLPISLLFYSLFTIEVYLLWKHNKYPVNSIRAQEQLWLEVIVYGLTGTIMTIMYKITIYNCASMIAYTILSASILYTIISAYTLSKFIK